MKLKFWKTEKPRLSKIPKEEAERLAEAVAASFGYGKDSGAYLALRALVNRLYG